MRKRLLAMLPLLTLGPVSTLTLPGQARSGTGAETGRIVGTVEISRALTPRRPQFRIYSDAGPGSTPPAPPSEAEELARELRNVIVYVSDTVAPQAPAADRLAVMAQSGERFDPHVLAVVQGAKVDFPNYDDVYHNVFSLSSARTFDLGRYPRGSSKSVTFAKRGVVQVFCHIHADMSGIILVLPNPWFSSPERSGRYVIDNVPPGEYTIVGWHERTRPVSRRIRVVAGQTTTMNFRLPLGSGSGE